MEIITATPRVITMSKKLKNDELVNIDILNKACMKIYGLSFAIVLEKTMMCGCCRQMPSAKDPTKKYKIVLPSNPSTAQERVLWYLKNSGLVVENGF